VLSTRDGFQHISQRIQLPLDVQAQTFFNARIGYIIGPPLVCQTGIGACSQSVAETRDGGQIWRIIATRADPTGPVAGSASGLWHAIGTAADPGAVLVSKNGADWRRVGQVKAPVLGCAGPPMLQFPTAGTAFAANLTSRGLSISTNGGKTFRIIWTPPQKQIIANLSFVSARVGFALVSPSGCSPSGVKDLLYRTRDAGRRWQEVGKLPRGTLAAAFLSSREGFALAQGKLWVSQTGGSAWRPTAIRPGVIASLDTVFPGSVDLTSGDAVTLFRTGDPPMHIHLNLGSAGSPFVSPDPVWVARGRLCLLLPGQGVWIGRLAARTTLHPLAPL
jgi:hypothetical protein